MKQNTRTLAAVSLLIALEVVLSRFFSIATPVMKIGFAFVPLALCALLYGPLWAAVAGAVSDLIGATLFPSGVFFPGFTLSAAVSGLIFGVFLYKKNYDWKQILLVSVSHGLIITMLMNSLWLSIITGTHFLAMVAARLIQTAIMIPVIFVTLWALKAPIHSLKKRFTP